MSRVMPVTSIC